MASHDDGALAGMRTYRVYLNVANSDDQVTSLLATMSLPFLSTRRRTSIKNAFGGPTSNDISAGAIGLVPELAFDSYVTIGLTGQPEGQEGTVELIPGTWMDAFEAGQSFDQRWYWKRLVHRPTDSGKWFGCGDDQRVLVAQLTTDGDISGQFRTKSSHKVIR